MSTLIGIMGEPGAGKSTSLRTLNPAETYYIDCDGKGLNWKGWRKQYNAENKNYYKTSFPQTVLKLIESVNEKAPHIKYVVIDTLNNLMTSEEMRNCKTKGYDKWTDMASYIWDIVDKPLNMRDDLTFIILFHTQTDMNDNGYQFTKIKTNGRKTEKNAIDSKFNWLFHAKKIDGKYYLETTANDSTARSPLGAFEDDLIQNDIQIVLKAIEEF